MSAQHTPGPVHLQHLNRKWLCVLLKDIGFYHKPTRDDPLEVIRSTVREMWENGQISSGDIHAALVRQENEALAGLDADCIASEVAQRGAQS